MEDRGCLLTIGVVFGFGLGALFVYPVGKHSTRIEAVEQGCAVWVTDTRGNSTFQWIDHESEADDE